MIVVGGLGSIQGAWYGAIVIGAMPQAINLARDAISATFGTSAVAVPGIESGVFGLLLIGIIILEPGGIHGRLERWRAGWAQFPLTPQATHRRQRSYLRTERVR